MTRDDAIKYWRIKRKDAAGKHRDAINVALDALINDRPTGEWLDMWSDGFTFRGTCSNCRNKNDIPPIANYCPVCGADMRGDRDV